MINEPLGNILNELRNSIGLYAKCQLYDILIKREGINYEINGTTGILYFSFLSHFLRFYLSWFIFSSIINRNFSSFFSP